MIVKDKRSSSEFFCDEFDKLPAWVFCLEWRLMTSALRITQFEKAEG
jgi:hypothetical protein